MKFVFFDEKMFDINEVYNFQKERIRAVSRVEADAKGNYYRASTEISSKSYRLVWNILQNNISLVIFEEQTINRELHTTDVFPVTLKFTNDMFGDSWMFQQNGEKPHANQKLKDWCRFHFSSFVNRDHGCLDRSDFNPLDYCISDKFVDVIN